MALRTRAPLAEVARPSSRPPGAPKYSDVCFSSRWFHPSNDKDPHDTFKTAKAFGATRFDWVYTLDPKFIGRAKAMGMVIVSPLPGSVSLAERDCRAEEGPGCDTT